MKLIPTATLLALTALSSAAIASNTLPVPNKATLTLKHVIATYENGAINQQPNAIELCSQVAQPLIGKTITTDYVTSRDSSHQVAASKLDGYTVSEYPAGLMGQFAFLSSGVPARLKQQNIKSIDFNVGINLGHPTSSVILTTNKPNIYCVVSNSKTLPQ